ncbi:16197_t:CDS:2, partial [Gigaspora margarita]
KLIMSNSNASEKYLKWLKEELEEGNIDFYEYSLFRNVKEIGKGGFGFIYSAEYDYDEVKVALKSLKTKEATKEFVSELKHLRAMKFNSYINQFYGITIEEIVAEEFITNDNRYPTPILTRNGTPNLLSVGPS